MVFVIPKRGLNSILVEIHAPDHYEIEVIKNIDTNIIIDPLYLDHPEDLYVLAYTMNDRPWDVLCKEFYNILESEDMKYRIHDMAAITGQSISCISNALRNIYFMKARRVGDGEKKDR